jgi:hypothetical protein
MSEGEARPPEQQRPDQNPTESSKGYLEKWGDRLHRIVIGNSHELYGRMSLATQVGTGIAGYKLAEGKWGQALLLGAVSAIPTIINFTEGGRAHREYFDLLDRYGDQEEKRIFGQETGQSNEQSIRQDDNQK